MAAPTPSALFERMAAALDADDIDSIPALADQVLAALPADPDAVQYKSAALCELGRAADAVAFLKSIDAKGTQFPLLRAYALFKAADFAAARALLDKAAATHGEAPGFAQLRAQVLYRCESFDEAAALYQDLRKAEAAEGDDPSHELATNTLAAVAAVGTAGTSALSSDPAVIGFTDSDIKLSYEVAYNAGCMLLAGGFFLQAEKQLLEAEAMCRDVLADEGADEAEIVDAQAIIRVQRAASLQLMNRDADALALLNAVLKAKPSDQTVAAVASNNVVSLKQDKDLFDSYRKTKSAGTDIHERNLFAGQKKTLVLNRCLLLLHMNKISECRDLVARLPDGEEACVVRAALALKAKDGAACTNILATYLDKQPDSLRVCLALAQAHVQSGDAAAAAAALARAPAAHRHRPGLVASLAYLYEAAGDTDAAVRELDSALAALKKHKRPELEVAQFLRYVGKFKLEKEMYKDAAAVYEELIKMDRNDKRALCGLVLAYAHTKPDDASKYEAKLPAIATSTDINADALENLRGTKIDGRDASARPGAAAGHHQQQEQQQEQHQHQQQKTKKKRKPRLPKDYDPNTAPDPERWLPKKERSSYQPKRSRKNKNIFKGAQGANAPAEQTSFVPKVVPTPASSTSSPGPRRKNKRR